MTQKRFKWKFFGCDKDGNTVFHERIGVNDQNNMPLVKKSLNHKIKLPNYFEITVMNLFYKNGLAQEQFDEQKLNAELVVSGKLISNNDEKIYKWNFKDIKMKFTGKSVAEAGEEIIAHWEVTYQDCKFQKY